MEIEIIERDSMGRSPELADQMSQNDPRPLKLGKRTKDTHAHTAATFSTYPKTLYKRAINRQGLPIGDPLCPNYPMPWDTAVAQGFDSVGFKHIGRNRADGGYVEVCWPWRTILVGVTYKDEKIGKIVVDLEASQAQEKKERGEGAVDHPSLLRLPDTPLIRKLLGKPELEDELLEDDELPEDPKSNGKARTAKTA